MGLFGRKKTEAERSTCCGGTAAATAKTESACRGEAADGVRSVKILGAGCKSCHEQYENAKAAAAKLGLDIQVEYITDLEKVTAYGAMSMPVVVVNEKVVSAGKGLKAAEVEKLLRKLDDQGDGYTIS